MSHLGLKENLPFLNGVYVAVNAVSDAYLVVDGPYCVIYKLDMQMAHDPGSTLMDPAGLGRVFMTDIRMNTTVVYNMATDRGHDIEQVLRKAASLPGAGVVLLTSMDFNHLLSVPLGSYRRRVAREGGAPVVQVDNESLDGDWLDGYARVLERLAAELDLDDAAPGPDRVAVVGHLMDRNEGDQTGNVAELERLVRGLGLDPVSVWPSGGPVAALREARRAGSIVSLPYGRAAARILGERLAVPVIEADLPLGLAGTGRFLAVVGKSTGREAEAGAFAESELSRVVPAVRRHVFRYLAGRRASVHADPVLALALPELLREAGIETVALTVVGEPRHLDETARAGLLAAGARFEPVVCPTDPLGFPGGKADLVVSGSLFPGRDDEAFEWVPLGYPSYTYHPIA
ncbi:MAG: hypothetical protein FJ087_21645, partial [Deltaproteobacteria bacterium]|nr:hypothetical protein [Deltaproteobacteria bacterium]